VSLLICNVGPALSCQHQSVHSYMYVCMHARLQVAGTVDLVTYFSRYHSIPAAVVANRQQRAPQSKKNVWYCGTIICSWRLRAASVSAEVAVVDKTGTPVQTVPCTHGNAACIGTFVFKHAHVCIQSMHTLASRVVTYVCTTGLLRSSVSSKALS
jgi:hypothetical protein